MTNIKMGQLYKLKEPYANGRNAIIKIRKIEGDMIYATNLSSSHPVVYDSYQFHYNFEKVEPINRDKESDYKKITRLEKENELLREVVYAASMLLSYFSPQTTKDFFSPPPLGQSSISLPKVYSLAKTAQETLIYLETNND
jgi:hypothetical protein